MIGKEQIGRCLERLGLWVFPRICIECSEGIKGEASPVEWDFLCGECARGLRGFDATHACSCCGVPVYGDLSQPITCGVCKESPPRWGRFFALTRYAGVSKRWVRDYKFHDARYLERDFRKLIGAKSSELSAFLANALLVPVPLHPLKEFLRGFNQSERLAKLLLEVSPTCAYEAQLLRRTRYTRQQAKLKRRERQKNVKKAFDINRKMPLDTLQSRRVVVVDDLLTTGSTVSACVQALKDAGFTTVDVLTFARV